MRSLCSTSAEASGQLTPCCWLAAACSHPSHQNAARLQEHNHSTDYGKITDSSLNAPAGPISLEHCLKPHLPKELS